MLRWFKKRKVQQGRSDASSLDLIPLKQLELSVVTTSLLATEPINEAWASVTGGNPMSVKSNFIVRMEMMYFFLHVVNRIAFDIGGPQAREYIQDGIATKVVEGAIKSSFDISQAQEGFDAQEWQERMIIGAVEGLNETELDYGSCIDLFAESPGPDTYLRDQYVVGKLAARIAQAVGQENNPSLWLLVATTAVEALAKSGLTDQIKQVCSLLGGRQATPEE